ncbi:hypothetical protein M2650_16025 [Luteimonas sp. SX5]|uniref:Uncharacterized protein n=1 Tax=Luteimonas galliterrae TaxID=2940486 RepID=A0ABT0MPB3_9GAMM|nr:hypothetical protein [Luteimonas galliterrae]MCL1636130.1 hypothetical protein [Luteimonas galliterrae]
MRNAIRPSAGIRHKLLGGCLGLALFGVLAFGLFLAAIFYYTSTKVAHTVAPPGDPRRFDPVAAYATVAAFAGNDARLTRLTARFVRSDGTLDLEADYRPSPNAQYRFVREVAAPADAPPIGAGSGADGRWYEQVQVEVSRPWEFRSVRSIGGGGSASYQYFNRGMQRKADAPTGRAPAAAVAAPACPFARLWADAIAHGAPTSAVATIEYDARGYDFRIDGLGLALRFDPDCSLASAR